MSVFDTAFISTGEIKSLTPIGIGVTDNRFDHNIKVAQDNSLRSVLGITLYNKIVAEIDDENISAVHQALIDDFIKPYMAYRVYELSIPDLYVVVGETGITKPTGTNKVAISQDDMKGMVSSAGGKADMYKNTLLDHLFASDDFPDFTTTTEEDDRSFSTNIGGIALGNDESDLPFGPCCRNFPKCACRTITIS